MKPRSPDAPARLAVVALVLAACTMPEASGAQPMRDLYEVENIAVSIRRSPAHVHAFIMNGENLPAWAKGLGTSIRREGGEWIADGPIGRVRVRFVPANDLGVADHDVVLSNGETVHNPLRVVPNGTGSTVIFTLMRLPGVSAQQFAQDQKLVERDLVELKTLLEQP